MIDREERFAVYMSRSRGLKFLALAMLLSILPARGQVTVQTSPFTVTTSDGVRIYVNHKFGPAPLKIPVLLIHGTWGNSGTWDFPGRSVMNYLAVRGYDVYALDMRGMGQSDNPGYSKIDLYTRMEDARAVAYQIKMNTGGQSPVVMGWSQGVLITGLLATSHPELVAGVGLLSPAPYGFVVPTVFKDLTMDFNTLIYELLVLHIPVDSFILTPNEANEVVFGTDPITGKPTISPDALAIFTSPQFLQKDSVQAIFEELQTQPTPTWLCFPLALLRSVQLCPGGVLPSRLL